MSVFAHIAVRVQPLRVLIADDHAPTRDDVRRALTDGGMEVCAEAPDAAHAVQLALETKPDICLLDIRMPGGGVAAAWEIAARLPTTKIVMLTVFDDDASLFAALRAGAVGYLTKDLDPRILPRALADAAEGKAAIPRGLVSRMVKQFHGTDPRFRTTAVAGELGPRLTSREWDVLVGLADGLSTREIARRLQLKQSGVRAHISAVVRKLGVEDRDEAVEYFRDTTR
ncbi:MAG TPA: response regulator transcription factor [Thermoleophilaceae bacterium]|nr:response regulator transcription factor [Thermoleophilaceae bacterium]